MNHYSKLAIVVLRLTGIILFLLGAMGLLYRGLAAISGMELTPELQERLVGGVWYVLAGVALFVLSRRLGKLIGRGLD